MAVSLTKCLYNTVIKTMPSLYLDKIIALLNYLMYLKIFLLSLHIVHIRSIEIWNPLKLQYKHSHLYW